MPSLHLYYFCRKFLTSPRMRRRVSVFVLVHGSIFSYSNESAKKTYGSPQRCKRFNLERGVFFVKRPLRKAIEYASNLCRWSAICLASLAHERNQFSDPLMYCQKRDYWRTLGRQPSSMYQTNSTDTEFGYQGMITSHRKSYSLRDVARSTWCLVACFALFERRYSYNARAYMCILITGPWSTTRGVMRLKEGMFSAQCSMRLTKT